MKRFHRVTLAVLFALTMSARSALASCAMDDPDGSRVAAARQQVAADCVCDQQDPPTVDHGQFVACAAGVANSRSKLDSSDPNYLPKTCKGEVKKCAAKSVCGKPGRVSCCIASGDTSSCKAAKSETDCVDRGGTPSLCTSCCDACGTGTGPSCIVPPSTTVPPTTLPPPSTTLP